MQGFALIQDAQHGEKLLGVVGKVAKSGGQVLRAQTSQDANPGVTQRGQRLRCRAGLDSAAIFAQRHVANPVQPVLDAPVAA